MTSAPDASFGHFCKQSFHQVEPTTAGRREVDVIARMPRQPVSHFADFMGAVVVHHQVDIQTTGEAGIDVVEEAEKLLVPVPSITTADGDSAGHIHGRK